MFHISPMPDEATLPSHLRLRARGAGSNASGRFEATRRVSEHDGWEIPEEDRLSRTEVTLERPRSAMSRNASPDLPFDRSINPYRGCEHGCIYCFARPSHAYLGLSPGLDFETRLIARPGIGAVLAKEFSAGRYMPKVLAIGTNTDPYQPIESRYRVMREILEVLSAFNHPVGIVTKGTLIERDIDILAPMAARGLAHVGISVTTLDPALARSMEPRTPAPARRLATIRRLTEAGIPVRVMAAPLIPALSDHELEAILEAGRAAGANTASYISLRLPLEVSGLFREWLETHYPDRAAHVMGRVRELHGGRDYDPEWGKRMRGEGLWAELMAQRFAQAQRRLGFDAKQAPLRTDLFRVPAKPGDQLSLDL
ncbi:MAG: PA0069 family radical SAM protein [Paracoccaceae bacterium]|nr:PA0069 family radical SAM protein [Paracoccaceae bacterium]